MSDYPLPTAEGDLGDGFVDFSYGGFDMLPGDAVLDTDLVALVVADTLVFRSMIVDGDGITLGSDITFTLPSTPVGYDVSVVDWSHAPDHGGRLGCLLTWWDAAGTARAALAWVQRRPNGSIGQQLIRFKECPPLDGVPVRIHGAYDPVANVMVAGVGTAGTHRWRAPFTVRLQTQDSVEEPGTGSLEQVRSDSYPTTCLRMGEDSFLLTAAGGVAEGASTHFIRTTGLATGSHVIDGIAGQGCIVGDVAYVPVATHDVNLTSDVHLWRYDQEPQQIGLVIATVSGTANWRPTGLCAQRLQTPDVIDPLAFDPLLGGFDDFLTGLLIGTIPMPVGAETLQFVVTASVPDQPPETPNPRSFPSYAMMVDLRAQLTQDDTGPAVIGPKFRLGYGDVVRLVVHPEGLFWVELKQDEGAEIPEGAPPGAGVEEG